MHGFGTDLIVFRTPRVGLPRGHFSGLTDSVYDMLGFSTDLVFFRAPRVGQSQASFRGLVR